MALVAAVHVAPLWHHAREFHNLIQLLCQRVADSTGCLGETALRARIRPMPSSPGWSLLRTRHVHAQPSRGDGQVEGGGGIAAEGVGIDPGPLLPLVPARGEGRVDLVDILEVDLPGDEIANRVPNGQFRMPSYMPQ